MRLFDHASGLGRLAAAAVIALGAAATAPAQAQAQAGDKFIFANSSA